MIPGARESNAGDDFHILWASRRALKLLDPDADLTRIRLEGLSSNEPSSRHEDLMLGIDLTEYYSGDNFGSAAKTVVSQLKYSVRHPSTSWTAARLSSKASKTKASVIRRLAEAFNLFYSDYPRELVIERLKVCLVSNQPLAINISEAINAAKKVLCKSRASITEARLLGALSKSQGDVIKVLRRDIKLGSHAFTDFLRVLDLTQCGAEPRSSQDLRLAQELGEYIASDISSEYDALYRRVQHEAMPESENSPGLNRRDLLTTLRVNDEGSLFPAPSKIIEVDSPIETENVRDLVQEILAGHVRILACGTPGCGKTTALSLIERKLAPASVVVTYDCFGGGDYLSTGETRHTPQRALLQLINTIHLRVGTPLLVKPPPYQEDLWRRFRRILEMAGTILSRNGGLLVVAIDAADNAVVGGREKGEDSFVPPMWDIPLPNNVVLVMTTRENRRNEVSTRDDISIIELSGFDETASSEYLRRFYPDADDQSCREFHRKTGGTPRIQSYLLQDQRNELEPLDVILSRASITPESIFKDIVDNAVIYVANPGKAQELIATLTTMTRPISLDTFAHVSELDVETATQFCRGLHPCAIIEGTIISFRDEDSEDYLRSRISPHERLLAHKRLANYYLPLERNNSEAAAAIADHLYLSGQKQELVDFVLAHERPIAMTETYLQLEVYRRRLSLALRSASELGNKMQAESLLILAAEAARVSGALTTIINENLALAMHFGDAEQIANICVREDNVDWDVPLYYGIAAAFSRLGRFKEARDFLVLAEASRRHLKFTDDNESASGEISVDAVAAGAEAIYWLEGAKGCARWLKRWGPPDALLLSVELLAKSLANQMHQNKMVAEISKVNVSPEVQARYLSAFWEAGKRASSTVVESVGKKLGRYLVRQGSDTANNWTVGFCELLASNASNRKLALELAYCYGSAEFNYPPAEWNSLEDFEPAIRTKSLIAVLENRSLLIDDLIPDRLCEKDEDEIKTTRRQFTETIGEVLPVFELRAQAILRSTSLRKVRTLALSRFKDYRESGKGRWRRHNPRFRMFARTLADTIVRLSGDGLDLLEELAALTEELFPLQTPDIWLDMVETAINTRYRDFAMRLADKCVFFVEDQESQASTCTSLLLRASSILERIDESTAADYYERALVAGQGLDDDSVRTLRAYCGMANHIGRGRDCLESAEYAERLARAVEKFESYVSDVDLLPYSETLEAVTRLCPSAGFALACRWDDESRIPIHEAILPVVEAATGDGYLKPEQSIWLLRLAGETYDISEKATVFLEMLRKKGFVERDRLARTVEQLSQWICGDLPTDRRLDAALHLLNWLDANGLGGLSGTKPLRELVAFLSGLSSSTRPSAQLHSKQQVVRPKKRSVFTRISLDKLDKATRRMIDEYANADEMEAFLVRVSNNIPASERKSYLTDIINLPIDHPIYRYYPVAILKAVRHLLLLLRRHKGIEDWVDNELDRLMDRHLSAIVGEDYYGTSTLPILLSFSSAHDITNRLLMSISRHLDVLSTSQISRATEACLSKLNTEELCDLLEWSLNRIHDPTDACASATPEPISSALAKLIWSCLGHYDKQVRWRAAHAARGIVLDQGHELLSSLIGLATSKEVQGFRSPNLPFYWMSARLWLMLLVARLASDDPRVLSKHLMTVSELALDSEFPHAAAREFARRASLLVSTCDATLLPESVLVQLKNLNQPKSCSARRESRMKGGRFASRKVTDSRFNFDSLDTLPYWYEHLARVFGLETCTIAKRAEEWIVDRLGFTYEDVWNDSRELRNEFGWEQMNNRQGSIPRLESLRLYLEYHAMLLVAGNLVDEAVPLAVEPHDDEDRWDDWLSRHLDTSPDWWISDLRSPTPLEPRFFGQMPEERLWKVISLQDFEHELGIYDKKPDRLIISSWSSMHAREFREYCRVSSCLVSQETSTSLMTALQTASNPNDFRLPLSNEDPDYLNHSVINVPGFDLIGWLTEVNRDWETIEEHDPLRRIDYCWRKPDSDFILKEGLITTSVISAKRANGDPAFIVHVWSDESAERLSYSRQSRQESSSGHRTSVELELLLDFLKRCQMDLVIESYIERQIDNRDEARVRQYEPGRSCIYLLRPNSTLENICGHRKIR